MAVGGDDLFDLVLDRGGDPVDFWKNLSLIRVRLLSQEYSLGIKVVIAEVPLQFFHGEFVG